MAFFSRSKGELSIIFDIGPQNVGVALLFKKNAEKPRIIWTHRESFVDEKSKDPRELLESMLSVLKKTNDILQKNALPEMHIKGFGIPSSALFILSSPWIEIEQKTIALTYEKPTVITQKILNDALNQEKKTSESSGFSLIERTIIGSKLNGYRIENPHNKKASSLELSFITAITPKEILNRIEETVTPKKSAVKAFSSVAYGAIKKIFQGNDFLFVAIEDNSTELIVVRDALLLLHTTIFSGSNALTYAIAKECNVSFAEAQSLVHLSFKKDINKDMADKVALIVKQERDVWRREVEMSLEGTGRFIPLPRTSFFIASDIGFIADIVQNQNVSEFGINQTPIDVVLLDPTSFKDTVLFDDASYADTRFGLITIGASQAKE